MVLDLSSNEVNISISNKQAVINAINIDAYLNKASKTKEIYTEYSTIVDFLDDNRNAVIIAQCMRDAILDQNNEIDIVKDNIELSAIELINMMKKVLKQENIEFTEDETNDSIFSKYYKMIKE